MSSLQSSLACGVYPKESDLLLQGIDKARDLSATDSSLARHLHDLRELAADTLELDAGLVGDDQLRYFEQAMKLLRRELGSDWDRLTKIGILHHHVNPIWRQQLELKPFESIIDAAQLKQAVTEFGFDALLHGHKHQNGVSVDAALVPTGDARRPDPVSIVSGGTVCGWPAPNDFQTFKLLILDRARHRQSILVEEYPLRETADPEALMLAERRVYLVPLADRIPEVHDDKALKELLDSVLLDEAIQRVGTPVARIDGAKTMLAADTDLVSAAARYRFGSICDLEAGRAFIDVFLATTRLAFAHQARIHWMLADVQRLAEATRITPRVLLIVGNLGDTHYSRERKAGEITSSITDLRAVFAPAVRSGLFEILEHSFSQEELEKLDQRIPLARPRRR